jgi:hypothetical protein
MAISNVSSGLRPGVCSSTTRPQAPFEGQFIYETDTDLVRVWNGSSWDTNFISSTSPALTGVPTAPTAAVRTNTTQIATTAFVNANTAWGVRAYNSRTTPDTSITSEKVQITGSSFTAVAGRLYKVTYFEPDVFPASGSGFLRARIRLTNISGTVLNECYEQLETSGTTNRFVNLVSIGTLSAGTQNVVATLFVSGATGYASRDASAKALLFVEDIGPA